MVAREVSHNMRNWTMTTVTRRQALAATAMLLAGCSGNGRNSDEPLQPTMEKKVEVVCATFPAYDWVHEVVGDEAPRFGVSYLMGSGVDLHSYQPTAEDITKIASADLFVYVGGESDGWAEDVVEAAGSPDLHALSMLDAVGDDAVEEELVEGMEAEHKEEEDAPGEEGPEYDEHVWLSLRNAQTLVDAIATELSAIDPEHADSYVANAQAYDARLAELDARYEDAAAAGAKDTIVFADRFPFRYLADDYGLSYYAAFVGCSAETEASFETVAFLAQKVDDLGLDVVLVIEGSDQRIAQTVVQSTETKDQQILVMNSLQSMTDDDVDAGKTYLSVMEENLLVLERALA